MPRAVAADIAVRARPTANSLLLLTKLDTSGAVPVREVPPPGSGPPPVGFGARPWQRARELVGPDVAPRDPVEVAVGDQRAAQEVETLGGRGIAGVDQRRARQQAIVTVRHVGKARVPEIGSLDLGDLRVRSGREVLTGVVVGVGGVDPSDPGAESGRVQGLGEAAQERVLERHSHVRERRIARVRAHPDGAYVA